jgi:hypothetical protein
MPSTTSPLPRLLALGGVLLAFAAGAPAAGAATPQIDAGDGGLCAVGADGHVTCHGLDASNVAHVDDFTAVGVGLSHACGLRAAGPVLCWSDGPHPATAAPPGSFTAVGSGWAVSCALDALGAGTCWGDDGAGYNQLTVPPGPLHGLAVGEFHACALQAGDTAVCWGADVNGQASPDAGTFTALSAGGGHTCGLRPSGSVDCWGLDNAGQAADRMPPAGETFVAVSAGSMSTCALTSTGHLVCWGANHKGETEAPDGTFSAVSVGRGYACALATSGALTCWGDDSPLPPHDYRVRFQAPADAAPTVKVARAGRVIPVKAEIFDGDAEVRTGKVTIDVVPASDCSAAAADAVEAYAPLAAGAPGTLRWDAAADRWKTELDTSGLGTGCFHVRLAVDGTVAGHFILRLRR